MRHFPPHTSDGGRVACSFLFFFRLGASCASNIGPLPAPKKRDAWSSIPSVPWLILNISNIPVIPVSTSARSSASMREFSSERFNQGLVVFVMLSSPFFQSHNRRTGSVLCFSAVETDALSCEGTSGVLFSSPPMEVDPLLHEALFPFCPWALIR